jgi:hypothetical protein
VTLVLQTAIVCYNQKLNYPNTINNHEILEHLFCFHYFAESLGALSPQQVDEISRLLGLYGRQQGPGTSMQSGEQQHNPPIAELLSYLRHLQEK